MDTSSRLDILLGSCKVSTAQLEDTERLAFFKECIARVAPIASHMSFFRPLSEQIAVGVEYPRLMYRRLLDLEDAQKKFNVPESFAWKTERCFSIYHVDLPRTKPLRGYLPRAGTFTTVLLTQKGKVILLRCQYRNAPTGTVVQAVRLFEPTDEDLIELLKQFCFKTALVRIMESLDRAIKDRQDRLRSLMHANAQLQGIHARIA